MLRNYIKVAFRRLAKNRFYTLINLLGLSVGFAAVLIIFLFVKKERSFDKFHTKLDRIEHLVTVISRESGETRTTSTSAPIVPEVIVNFPQVEAASRYDIQGLKTKSDSILSNGEEVRMSHVKVDQDFFEIFDFRLKWGQYPDFSKQPNAAVITEEKAELMYGNSKSALGKTFPGYEDRVYVVSGVIENVSSASSIRFDVITSLQYAYPEGSKTHYMLTLWGNDHIPSVLLFNEGITSNQKQEVLEGIGKVYRQKTKYMPNPISFGLQPFSIAHFDLETSDRFSGQIDESYLLIFSAIAIIILISSLSNYCSLTLSQSVERTKEIGVRRVVGARRFHILGNYMIESFLLATAAFVFSLIITELSIPLLEDTVNRSLGIEIFASVPQLAIIYSTAILISLISVLYPAIIISKKKINDFKHTVGSRVFSKNVVINIINGFQVTVFIFLLAATVFVNKQLSFMQNTNLGFDKENILMVSVNTRESIFKKDELKNKFAKSPFVDHVGIVSNYPREKGYEVLAKEEQLNFIEYKADAEFFDIMGFTLLEGRKLENSGSHEKYVVINQTAAKALGFENPVGETFNGQEIIGVMADFHAESKREPIKPLALKLFEGGDGYGWVMMRVKGNDIQGLMADINQRYEAVTDSNKIVYQFFDEDYQKIYKSELVIKHLMEVFTVVALLISFFGVLGTSSYTVKRRLKEISIRKDLGANLFNLNSAINRSGVAWFFLGALIAVPASLLWVKSWLTQFSYQAEITVLDYLPLLALSFALILPAMLFQVVKAFHSKTVDYLKDE
jgi:putative ABC transport system permease protein